MAIKLRKFSKEQSAEAMEKWAYKVARDYNSEIKGILESGGSKSQILAAMDEEIKKICKQLDKKEDREFSKDLGWGWAFHAVYDNGEEYILYSNDPFETKSECKDDLEYFIEDEKEGANGDILRKADSKSCMKLTGESMLGDLKKKYPKAKVEGV